MCEIISPYMGCCIPPELIGLILEPFSRAGGGGGDGEGPCLPALPVMATATHRAGPIPALKAICSVPGSHILLEKLSGHPLAKI